MADPTNAPLENAPLENVPPRDVPPRDTQPRDTQPQNVATPEPDARRRRPSLVWLMPLLAVLVALFVVWTGYRDQGPLVTVAFPSAAGIQAGATELRIRDIRVGVVEEVGFTDGLAAVEARIRVDQEVARYIDADARFWLVQPQVSARGVTGIGTILSGVYIEASFDGVAGAPASEFTALANPPLEGFGEEGTRVVLRTRAGGQLAAGAPVLATGIEVGRIGQPVLSESGNTVTMDAFIAAPYDARLTTNSRFWDASGLSVNVGTGGLDLRIDSLAALVEGGVNFGTPVTGGEPVEDGHVFDVFASEDAAREDAFEGTTDPDLPLSVVLDADVSGLGIGTVVRFRGIKAGEVTDVVGLAPEEGSDERVRLLVDMELTPGRIGLRPGLTAQQVSQVLAARVARGLRMRPATEGLFGQSVVLELASVPGAAPAELLEGPDGRVLFPTAEAVAGSGATSVDGLVARVSQLPIEEVMAAAADAMTSVSRLAGTAEGVLASDGVRALPATIDGTLAQVTGLVADVREGGAIDSFNGTLRSVEGTMASVDEAARELPQIVAGLSSTAEGTLANVSTLAGTANAVLASDGVSRLPATVDATLGEVRGLLAQVREGGAVESVERALGSAESTLASVDAAARSLPETVASLSASATTTLEGVARLTGVAETTLGAVDAVTQSLPATLERVTGATTGTLANVSQLAGSADALLRSEAVASLPATIDGTLAQVTGLVTDVREGGAVENVNATLESARATLRSVETAASGLPATVDALGAAATDTLANVSGLVGAAGTTLANVETLTGALPDAVGRLTESATDTLGNVSRLAGSADDLLRSEAVARLPGTIEGTLGTAEGTLAEARGLLLQVREGGAVESLNETLAFARGTLANVSTAAQTLPSTVDALGTAAIDTLGTVSGLATTAEGTLANVDALTGSLPATIETVTGAATDTLADVGRLAGTADRTLTSANALLSSEAVAGLPRSIEATLGSLGSTLGTLDGTLGTLDGTLGEARALVAGVRESGAIEALNATLRSAQGTLASVEASVTGLPGTVEALSAAATDALADVAGLASTADALLASEPVAGLPATLDGTLGTLDGTLGTLDGTLAEIRTLASELREGGAVANVNGAIASAERALASAETTLASIDGAAQALPRQIEALSAGASEALASIGTLAGTADGVLRSDGVDALPATINATLGELRATAETLREGGAVESLNATLASARDTLASVEAAADALPATVESLSGAADAALTNVAGLAETAQGVLGAEGVDRLPVAIEGTLGEVRALSEELRVGGAVESLNATLRRAEAALVSVDTAAQSLPALVARLDGAAAGLVGVVNGYSQESRVYEDLRGVLREASATAEAFRSLARTIERRPNALLTGR